MRMRLVYLWSARAQQAVLRRIASDTRLPLLAYSMARWAGFVCLKTHNQRMDITTEEANY